MPNNTSSLLGKKPLIAFLVVAVVVGILVFHPATPTAYAATNPQIFSASVVAKTTNSVIIKWGVPKEQFDFYRVNQRFCGTESLWQWKGDLTSKDPGFKQRTFIFKDLVSGKCYDFRVTALKGTTTSNTVVQYTKPEFLTVTVGAAISSTRKALSSPSGRIIGTISGSGGGAFSGGTGTTTPIVTQTQQQQPALQQAPAAQTFILHTIVTPSGRGTITGSGISCTNDCTASFPFGSSATLNAQPSSGYVFSNWGGDCSGTASTCVVVMSDVKSAVATFSASSTGGGTSTGSTGTGITRIGTTTGGSLGGTATGGAGTGGAQGPGGTGTGTGGTSTGTGSGGSGGTADVTPPRIASVALKPSLTRAFTTDDSISIVVKAIDNVGVKSVVINVDGTPANPSCVLTSTISTSSTASLIFQKLGSSITGAIFSTINRGGTSGSNTANSLGADVTCTLTQKYSAGPHNYFVFAYDTASPSNSARDPLATAPVGTKSFTVVAPAAGGGGAGELFNLDYTVNSATEVQLKWAAVQNTFIYFVDSKSAVANENAWAKIGETKVTTFTAKVAQAGIYNFRVRALDQTQQKEISKSIPVTVDTTTSTGGTGVGTADKVPPDLTVKVEPPYPDVGKTFTITASAFDDNGMDSVDIYLDDSLAKNCLPVTGATTGGTSSSGTGSGGGSQPSGGGTSSGKIGSGTGSAFGSVPKLTGRIVTPSVPRLGTGSSKAATTSSSGKVSNSPQSASGSSGNTLNCIYTKTSGLTRKGTHTYAAKATDASGNLAEKTGIFKVGIDETPPQVAVSHTPLNPQVNQKVLFTVALSDDYGVVQNSVAILVDNVPLSDLKCGGAQSSAATGGQSSQSGTVSNSPLSAPKLTGKIAAPSFPSIKKTPGTSQTTGGSSSSSGTGTSASSSPTSQTACLTEKVLLPGVHTYYAEAKDKAGNKGRDPGNGTKTVTVGSGKLLTLEVLPGSVTHKKAVLKWNKYDDALLTHYLIQAKPASVPEEGKRGHGKRSEKDVWTTISIASKTDTGAVIKKLRPNREYQLRLVAMKGPLSINIEKEIEDEAEIAEQQAESLTSSGGEDQSSSDSSSSTNSGGQKSGIDKTSKGGITPPSITGKVIAGSGKSLPALPSLDSGGKKQGDSGSGDQGQGQGNGGGKFKGDLLPQDALQISNIVNIETKAPGKLKVEGGEVSGTSLEVKWDKNSIKSLVDEANTDNDVDVVLRVFIKEASQPDEAFQPLIDADGKILNLLVDEGSVTISGLAPNTDYVTRIDIYGIGSEFLIDSSDTVSARTKGVAAIIVADPTSGLAPLEVAFDGSQSSSPVGEIISYEWSFGDGSDTEIGATATHIYEASDTFTATLTVTDDNGNQGINSVTIDATGTALGTTSSDDQTDLGVVDDFGQTEPDSDGDGVPDSSDICADTPTGETADASGCSNAQNEALFDVTSLYKPTIEDSDGDGILDNYDACPGTSSGVSVDGNGCEVGQGVQKTSCTVDDFKRSRVIIGFDVTQIADSCGKSGKWLVDIFRSAPTDAQPTGVQGRDSLPDQRDACSAIIPDLDNGIDTHRVYCGLDDSWYYVTYSASLKQAAEQQTQPKTDSGSGGQKSGTEKKSKGSSITPPSLG